MPHTDLKDIFAFLAVARAKSFTRAAAQLGVSKSALSQTVRGLEARLIWVLAEWCPPYLGYHLNYPSGTRH